MVAESSDVLSQFRKIPTGNIADALVGVGVSGGVVEGPVAISRSQPSYAGWAVTVQQTGKTGEGPGSPRHRDVIDDLASPDAVVVIDVGGRTDVCSLGGLLAQRAKYRGLAGLVVNGCVRDANDIVKSGFPVHCVGTSPKKSSVELDTESIDEPLEINGCVVRSGDLIVGDDTGVVCVPRSIVDEVLVAAAAISVLEDGVAAQIDAGVSIVDAFDNLSD